MILGTKENGQEIKVDLPHLLESKLLIQANSGGGKSWAVRRILEQTHGAVQQIVLDPEGEFSSLRGGPGLDYVYAAKQGGDTAADPRSAKLLAIRLLELNVSAVIDIYELKHHDRIKFVRAFFEAMVDAPKKLWHPALVVLDEAHVFCPEKGQAESAGAVIDAATRFRKRGYGLVLATQRLAKLNKDAAAELNNKLIGRCALDLDRKRGAEELGFTTREEQLRLRTLKPGDFFCFGPAISDTVEAFKVGAVLTHHPKAGQRSAATPPPKEKVKKVLDQLADLPKEAEEENRTVAGLQAKVRELESQIAKRPEATRAAPAKTVMVPVLSDSQIKRLADIQKKAFDHATVVSESVKMLDQMVRNAVVSTRQASTGTVIPQRTVAPAPAAVHSHQNSPPRPIQAAKNGLPKAERLILTVLAQHQGKARSVVQVAIQAGYAVTGGGFNNALGALRSQGLIEGDKAGIRITEDGIAAAGHVLPLPTGQDLIAHWQKELPKAECLILGALQDVYPGALSKQALAEKTGYQASGGGFNNALSKLRTLSLIAGRDDVSLSREAMDGL